jgi:hypothetical protein
MNVRALFVRQPAEPLSSWRVAIASLGLLLLGVMVLAYAIGITTFFWAEVARPRVALLLVFIWVVSITAVFFIVRGARHWYVAWPRRPRR